MGSLKSIFQLDEGEIMSTLRGRWAGLGAARAGIGRVKIFGDFVSCCRLAFGGTDGMSCFLALF